jgi:hypothetical protein
LGSVRLSPERHDIILRNSFAHQGFTIDKADDGEG